MPRVRKVKIYDFKTSPTGFSLDEVSFDFRKLNISKQIRAYKKYLKENCNGKDESSIHKRFGLPLPITPVCKFIGVIDGSWKSYNKKNRGNYSPRYQLNTLIEKFYDHYELNDTEDKTAPLRQVFTGDFKYSSWNIEQMAADTVGFKYNELIDGISSRIGLDLQLPYLGFLNLNGINHIGVNPKASSGYRTSRYINKKRNRSTNQSKQYALEYQQMIIKSKIPVVDRSLQEIGGREKLVKNKFVGEKRLKTRVTLQLEDIPTLIGQNIVTQVNPKLQEINDGFNWGGVINGRRNALELYERLNCNLIETINTCLDYDTHDSRICEETLVTAMGLIRLVFDENEDWDKIFFYVLSSMVYKRVVIPDCGMIFELSKGISTGHPFTSIMNTLCAYLTLSTSIQQACTPDEIKNSWITNAGDDTICKLPLLKLKPINWILQNKSGMKMSDIDAAAGTLTTNDFTRNVSFLKYKWNLGLFSWNELELFQNFIYPTTRTKSLSHQVNRMKFFTVMAPFDPVIQELVKCSILVLAHNFMNFKVPWSDLPLFNRYKYTKILHKSYIDQTIERFSGAPRHPVLTPNEFTWYNLKTMKEYLNDVDRDARISKNWMLEWRPFKKVEHRIRIKIFDKNKVFIPRDTNFNVSALSWKYEVKMKSIIDNDGSAFRRCLYL